MRSYSPRLDPLHDLGDPPDRVGVGLADLVEEAADAVARVIPVLVLHRLGHERVEVELVGAHRAGGDHQRAADDLRVAHGERGGAIAAELGRAVPLEQHRPDGAERDPEEERHAVGDREQDVQRGDVDDVIGEDVAELVGEHDALLAGAEPLEQQRVDRRSSACPSRSPARDPARARSRTRRRPRACRGSGRRRCATPTARAAGSRRPSPSCRGRTGAARARSATRSACARRCRASGPPSARRSRPDRPDARRPSRRCSGYGSTLSGRVSGIGRSDSVVRRSR